MTTYIRPHAKIYRRIYEQTYGPIPAGHDIHHKDGDPFNNDPSNLIALTPEEHYNIHLQQGDYRSASMIAKRIHYALSSEQLSEIARLSVLEQIKNGKHNLSNPILRQQYVDKQMQEGTHPFLRSDIQSNNGIKGAAASRAKRTTRFLSDNPNSKLKTCEHCGKEVTAPVYGKCHGVKCKSLQHSDLSNL